METRTNIVLDDELLAKAMERAGVKTKKAAIEAALLAYVREPDYAGLLALAGSDAIADDYDPKAPVAGSQAKRNESDSRTTHSSVAKLPQHPAPPRRARAGRRAE